MQIVVNIYIMLKVKLTESVIWHPHLHIMRGSGSAYLLWAQPTMLSAPELNYSISKAVAGGSSELSITISEKLSTTHFKSNTKPAKCKSPACAIPVQESQ